MPEIMPSKLKMDEGLAAGAAAYGAAGGGVGGVGGVGGTGGWPESVGSVIVLPMFCGMASIAIPCVSDRAHSGSMHKPCQCETTETTVTGRVESAPNCIPDGACPAMMSCAPKAAIMAPLSVQ